jgi:monoamine oxidase
MKSSSCMSRVNRRQFIKRSAIAVAGASLVRSPIITATVAPKKIIVIGAGMAGLSAAYELSQLGHDVTILEARKRPGGRVQTLREPFSDGLYAEAGAARIPSNHDLTLKYVKLFNLELEPMYPSRLSALRIDGNKKQEVSIEKLVEGFGQYFGDEIGGSPARFSKIRGGNDNLPRAFAQRLGDKILYGSPVVRIDQDANSARVVFLRDGMPQTLTADRILCAIPYSLLRNVELPSSFSARKIQAIKTLKYDAVSRVYLQTKKRSWEENGLSGFGLTNEPIEIWQPTWNQAGPRGILMTYARPGQAERITSMKESERIGSTLAQLSQWFPGLKENFETGVTKCWTEDEWSRGAWAFAGLNPAAYTPEGRVHFAGEHLSMWFSWMQGALDSSQRAVKQILDAG